MFDWNDQDQVSDTIWGKLNENEDHIVPYGKDNENNTLFTFGDYKKKENDDDAGSGGRSVEQTSGVKNELPGGSMENCSSFNADEELSASGLDTDAWPDLPCLNVELNKEYADGNVHDSLGKEFSDKVTVQLNGSEPKPYGNEIEDREGSSFLDCDWSNIEDFDDLDKILRNDSVFGTDMIVDVDDFLAQSTEVIGSTAQSIPLPDLPASRDLPTDQDCSSSQFVEHPDGKIKLEVKAGDRTVGNIDKNVHQPHPTDQLSEKEDRKKKLLKSRKKAEERSKNKALQNLNGTWSHNISKQFPNSVMQSSVINPLHTFQSLAHHRPTGDAESTRHLSCPNQFMFSHYAYPPYPFPGIPMVPHVQAEGKHRKTAAHQSYPDQLEHSNVSNKMPEVQSRQSSMTPQEKIEKLRRRQQIQAMVAIQQQQQQQRFGHQMTGAKILSSQGNPQDQTQEAVTSSMEVEENLLKLPSSNMTMLLDCDDTKSLEEAIYYQLQDVLCKLDDKVRLCIRDSLLRLAKSAMERQNANDRSSKNEDVILVNEGKPSYTSLPDAETCTNPIDRIVANLLFGRPPEQCTTPMNYETPHSGISTYKLPHNIDGSITEDHQHESFGDMEVEPSS